MLKKYIALCTIAAVSCKQDSPKEKSDHWAVIVAGSNTYQNYRHQADTCHAFQIMKKNGIPEEQIIHLSYNDVAKSWHNPFSYRGKLFNKPTKKGVKGVDVNDGCIVDYEGK